MTDNRTTELLREGLTERGIEWRSGLEGVTFVGDWCFVEYDNGKLAGTCEPVLTPEQAIAATLGSEYHGYEQAAIEAWESIKAWNTRAANDTLTAEQVREAIEANSWAETSTSRAYAFTMHVRRAIRERRLRLHATMTRAARVKTSNQRKAMRNERD